jgi:ATP-dependent protease ClpP protease subunit
VTQPTSVTSRADRRAVIQARTSALVGTHSSVRVASAAVEPSADDTTEARAVVAELWLYGTVGGWWWGFDAETVSYALRQMPDDVTEIRVRLHSPGGNAIEGIAIGNLLRNHDARVVVVVDGLAASAASIVALAGDEIVMSPGSQYMIHDPWLLSVGNAADLRSDADYLDKQARNYAEVYALRAGGTADEWRDVMLADNGRGTWYTAQESVDAGLADRVGTITAVGTPPPNPMDDVDLDDDDAAAEAAARAAFDLDVLVHPAARAAWSSTPAARSRAPKPPTASADGTTHTGRNRVVNLTDDARKNLTAKLGISEDADDATILAALDEVLAEQAADETTPPAAPATPAAFTVPDGMVLMDSTTAESLRSGAAAGIAARDQQLAEHRDRTIQAAIDAGKIPPARRAHYEAAWKADATGTEQVLAALEPGLVPVTEQGHDNPDGGTVAATTLTDEVAGELGGFFGLSAEELTRA